MIPKAAVHGIVFGIGAAGYGLMEIVFRGTTHWSMVITGGICSLGLGCLDRRFRGLRPIYQGILGSLLITSMEFLVGCIFNLWLKCNVWDYSAISLNLKGQVCLLFSVIWGFVSIGAIRFIRFLYRCLLQKGAAEPEMPQDALQSAVSET